MGVDFGILILILNIKREKAVKGERGLFNSIIIDKPLYLTNTKIDKERD